MLFSLSFISLSFILGLAVGSFLNVLIDRLPNDESPFKGRSYCDKCRKKLVWFDMIPILSFFLLRGKCRLCHSSISVYYPIVELITAVLFISAVYLLPQISIGYQVLTIKYMIDALYYWFIVSSLIVIFFTDLKYGIIPDKIVYPAIAISFLYLIFLHSNILISNIVSSIGVFLFFLFLYFITKGRGMGLGDVKLVFFLGLLLGFPKIIIALYIAFLTGAVAGLILIMWKKKRLKIATIPFGPFLALGTFLSYFLSEKIIFMVLP